MVRGAEAAFGGTQQRARAAIGAPPGLTRGGANPMGTPGNANIGQEANMAQTNTAPLPIEAATPSGRSDNEDNYFRFFTTPPDFTDSRFRDQQHAQRELTRDEQVESANGEQSAMYNGEPAHERSSQTGPWTGRKRLWSGTPDPEDVRRGTRRPRPAGSTPLLRSGAFLPNASLTATNPWVNEQKVDVEGLREVQEEENFAPVAASTPLLISVPVPTPIAAPPLTQLPRQYVPSLPDAPSFQRNCSERRETLQAPDALFGPNNPALNEGRNPFSALPQTQMDIDGEEWARDPDSPSPDPPRRGKGKARATTEDMTPPGRDTGREQASSRAQDAEGDWDERDLLQARQNSLRQVLSDRAGDGRTNTHGRDTQTRGAGPSRYNHDFDAGRYGENGGNTFAREGYTSRTYNSLSSRSRARRIGDEESGHTHAASEARRPQQQQTNWPERGRDQSEFRPLPNTRAADYLAGRGADQTQLADARSVYRHSYSARTLHEDSTPRNDNRHEARSRMEGNDPAMTHDYGHRTHVEDEGDDRLQDGDAMSRGDEGNWATQEDGEVVPSALRDDVPRENTMPTIPPPGGFPSIHRDDPEAALRGLALDWMREIWSDAPNSDVLVQIYNYKYSEDDALNRRIAEALRWAFETMTGETDFDVVPPELEDGARRTLRDLPSIWVVRGLSPMATLTAIATGTWSYERISFTALPRTAGMQSWLFTLEGFLEGNADKIRQAILRVLQEDTMAIWIAEMLASNPSFDGWSPRRAMSEFLSTLRVEVLQLGNGNYIANAHIRPPTRNLREWRAWAAELRSRRYRSFAIGTGRVRPVVSCSGCTSVAHPAHLCPFPRIRGWNGPGPGEGVFGERAGRGSRQGPMGPQTQTSSWNGASRGGRRDPGRRGSPWGGSQSRQDPGRGGYERNDRGSRNPRDERDRRNHRNDRNNDRNSYDRSGSGGGGRAGGSGGRKRL